MDGRLFCRTDNHFFYFSGCRRIIFLTAAIEEQQQH